MILIDKWWKIVLISMILGNLLSKLTNYLSEEKITISGIIFSIFVGYILFRYKHLVAKDLEGTK